MTPAFAIIGLIVSFIAIVFLFHVILGIELKQIKKTNKVKK
jgi:hypothetical protein